MNQLRQNLDMMISPLVDAIFPRAHAVGQLPGGLLKAPGSRDTPHDDVGEFGVASSVPRAMVDSGFARLLRQW
ncbi:MAG: hypothetical protein ACRCUI_01870, partial [Polymorphobacter sp.]